MRASQLCPSTEALRRFSVALRMSRSTCGSDGLAVCCAARSWKDCDAHAIAGQGQLRARAGIHCSHRVVSPL